MDTAYAKLGLPFRQALFVVGTVISVRPDHAVADVGLKALGMDHGNPSIDGATRVVLQRRARHVRARRRAPRPSATACASSPAHVDPTMAMHEAAWLVDGDEVLDRWAIDLRGWGRDDHDARDAAGVARRRRHGRQRRQPVGRAACAWRWATAARSLMPWAALSAGPVAVGAARHAALAPRRRVRRRRRWPAWRWPRRSSCRRRQPPADPARPPAHASSTATCSTSTAACADVPGHARPLDADVLTFSELTPSHAAPPPPVVARRRATRTASSCRRRYASGTGLWSRYPLTERRLDDTKHHTVVADVDAAGRRRARDRASTPRARSPTTASGSTTSSSSATLTVDRPGRDDRRLQRRLVAPRVPPPARRTAGATPTSSLGHGLSCSWPTDRGTRSFHVHPPFVRLDHALVNDGLAVLDVDDFDVPGSDHLGLVVTVQRARASSALNARPRCDRACFSSVAHLGERAPVAVVGHEHGVVAEPARRPARPSAIVPSHTPSTASSRPSGHTTIATVRNRARRSSTPSSARAACARLSA